MVLLQAYGEVPVQTTQVLVGVVTKYNKEGYGPRLTVSIPLIAGGLGALTDFQAMIFKKFNYKGKQRSYVSSKCPKSKKLKARGQVRLPRRPVADPGSDAEVHAEAGTEEEEGRSSARLRR